MFSNAQKIKTRSIRKTALDAFKAVMPENVSIKTFPIKGYIGYIKADVIISGTVAEQIRIYKILKGMPEFNCLINY